MSLVLIALLCLVASTLYWINGYLRYRRNIEIAKNFVTVHQFISPISVLWELVPDFIFNKYLEPRGWYKRDMWRVLPNLFEKHNTNAIAVVDFNDIIVNVNDPEVVKEITVTKRNRFPKAVQYYQVLNVYGENIVTAADDGNWKRHRIISNAAFSDANLQLVREIMIENTKKTIEYWQRIEKKEDDLCVDINTAMLNLTLSVISGAGFGVSFEIGDAKDPIPEGHKISFKSSLMMVISNLIWRLIYPKIFFKVPFFPRLKEAGEAFGEYEQYVKDIMVERKELLNSGECNRRDLLTLLLDSGRKLKEDSLSDQEIVSNIFTFMFAGHETTAHTLTFATGMLAMHQDVQQKVYEEILKVLDGKDEPSFEDFQKFTYLRAVIKEVMRLYPPVVHIPKCAKEDEVVANSLEFKKDITVHISIYSICHNKDVYPDPMEFKPERFDPSSPESAKYADIDLVAFSMGPRSCLGVKFAMVEMVMFLVVFLKNYRIKPLTPENADLLKIEEIDYFLTLNTKKPLHLNLEKRQPKTA